MQISPETFTAICAGVTLLIYFTATLVGATVSIFRKIDKMRNEILADVSAKHAANDERYEALHTLVIRHNTILEPQFNGSFKHHG